MNREELTEAIHDMARDPHVGQYALGHAMAKLDLHLLVQLFDVVAEHHTLLHPPASWLRPRETGAGR